MVTPQPLEDSEELAALMANAALAKRVARWMRNRLAIACALTVCGPGFAFWPGMVFLAVPCCLLAAATWFMFLEARDHHKEIVSRKWKSLTPRTDRVIRDLVDPTQHSRRVAA